MGKVVNKPEFKNLNETFKQLLEVARQSLIGQTQVKEPDFRLEQAVLNENESIWDVVVSFLVVNKDLNHSNLKINSPILHYKFFRQYKRLKIDTHMNIKGMYIYNEKL